MAPWSPLGAQDRPSKMAVPNRQSGDLRSETHSSPAKRHSLIGAQSSLLQDVVLASEGHADFSEVSIALALNPIPGPIRAKAVHKRPLANRRERAGPGMSKTPA